jgi:hypothetical protein
MKFFVTVFLTALLAFAEGLFFPWWSVTVAAFIVALFIHQKAWKAFLAAFISIFLFWGIYAFVIDSQNQQILSRKVALILPLGGSSEALILVTAFVGGLIAGMAGLTGSLARRMVERR